MRIIAPKPSEEHLNGARIVTVPTLEIEHFPVGFPDTELIRSELKRFKPDVLHAAGPFGPLGYRAIKAANKFHIPSVAIYQTDIPRYVLDHGFGQALMQGAADRLRRVHDRATLSLAPSHDALQTLKSYRVDMKRVGMWGRGVDIQLYNPERRESAEVQLLRRELSPDGRPIVGYVGRLASEKSVENLKSLVGLPAEIVIVGDGPSRQSLEGMMAGQAQFCGTQSGEDLANYYATFDVFVHTGLRETFGQTLQEAMATGLPVVAPATGGPLDIVRHDESGLLYQPSPGNTELVAYTEYILHHPHAARAMGARGRELVEKRSWRTLGQELLRYYALAEQMSSKKKH